MTTTPNEQHIELTYNPIKSGLSVSQLNMWLVDKAAYEMQYLRGWEAVEPWDPKLNFGKLFMAGIEGYVKSGHQLAGGFSYIDKETEAQIRQYATYDDIHFWSYLSREMLTVFVELHSDWLLEYCEESETKHTIELETPNGKTFVLSGRVDGQSHDGSRLFENKCRASWNEEGLVQELKWELQVNYYYHLMYTTYGKLPKSVWYMNVRRPWGFASRSPKRRKGETDSSLMERLVKHIRDNPSYYFVPLRLTPSMDEFQRFCHKCLYPILQAFDEWWTQKTNPDEYWNTTDWITPYGLFNPFTEGIPERFRHYRLYGSTRGLRPRRYYRGTKTPEA
jgi:hypothetical protein